MGHSLAWSELRVGRQWASSRRSEDAEALASVSSHRAPGGQGKQLPEGSWRSSPPFQISSHANGASEANTVPASQRHPPVVGSGELPGGHVPQWFQPGAALAGRAPHAPVAVGAEHLADAAELAPAEPLGATPPGGHGAQAGAEPERLWPIAQARQAKRRPLSSRRISSPGGHAEQLDEPRGAYLRSERCWAVDQYW